MAYPNVYIAIFKGGREPQSRIFTTFTKSLNDATLYLRHKPKFILYEKNLITDGTSVPNAMCRPERHSRGT